MNTVEILQGARERLSTPRRWRKHDYGPDEFGRTCLTGACAVAGGVSVGDIEDSDVGVLLRECAGRTIHIFNDDPSTKHADVLRVIDCAIAKASA